MPGNIKTFDQIVNDIFARLTEAGITDFNPGSVARTLVEAFAYGLDEVWYALSQVPDKFLIDKATGEWLDRRAWEWGITRNPGAKAKGNVVVSRTTPAPFGQLIPAGTQFAYGELVYQSTQDVELAQGATEAIVPVEAMDVGKAYNLPSGTELKQVGVAISLIEAVRVGPEGIVGGVDPESDDELRERLLTRIRKPPTSGNVSHYLQWAFEVPGVGGAKVLPLWDGPGTVKVVLLGTDKQPAPPDVVEAVQAYIDPNPGQGEGMAPIGARVTVVAATPVPIDVSATVIPTGTKTLAEIQAAFERALTEYLQSIAFGADPTVRYVRIGSLLLDTDGVRDYVNLTVNGGTANVPIGIDEVAVKGTVVLNE